MLPCVLMLPCCFPGRLLIAYSVKGKFLLSFHAIVAVRMSLFIKGKILYPQ